MIFRDFIVLQVMHVICTFRSFFPMATLVDLPQAHPCSPAREGIISFSIPPHLRRKLCFSNNQGNNVNSQTLGDLDVPFPPPKEAFADCFEELTERDVDDILDDEE